jgi:hypothetical protein
MGLLIPTNVIYISLYRNKYICWNCTFSFQEFLFEKCYLWTCIITLLFCYVLFYPLLFCDFNAVTSVLNRSSFLSLYPIFRVEYAISYHFLKTLWVNYIWFVRIPTKTTFTAVWRQLPCVTENGLNKRERERVVLWSVAIVSQAEKCYPHDTLLLRSSAGQCLLSHMLTFTLLTILIIKLLKKWFLCGSVGL